MDVPSDKVAKVEIPRSIPTNLPDLGRRFLGTLSSEKWAYHWDPDRLIATSLILDPKHRYDGHVPYCRVD